MKKIWVLISLLPIYIQAEVVTGSVRESSSNDGIAYATVSVLKGDSTLLTGTITNDNGYFSIEAEQGDYILQVSYVGYKTVHRAFTLNQKKTDLGNIYLTEETIVMDEVEIKADKPLIQRQMEKIVIHVEKDGIGIKDQGHHIVSKIVQHIHMFIMKIMKMNVRIVIQHV